MIEKDEKQKEQLLKYSAVIEADETMVEEASWVASRISESETMLPKTTEDILALFAEGRSVLVVDDMGHPIAHGAVTFLYEDAHVLEVGSIIVDESRRGQGLGMLATESAIILATLRYPGWTKMALCNQASLPIFLKLGAEVVTFENLDVVPSEAWEACLTCPSYHAAKGQGKICCDTPVIIPDSKINYYEKNN